MQSISLNILLTGARAPATLHLARLLGKGGCQVFTADTFSRHAAGYSKYVTKNLTFPSPALQFEAFRESIQKIVKQYQIDWVIPTCEEVYYLSMMMDELPPQTKVFTSSISTLQQLHSKFQFIELLEELSLPSPKTSLVADRDTLEVHRQRLKSYVLKPEYSRFADKVIIDRQGELLEGELTLEVNTRRKWVVQAFIEGAHFCSYSVVRQGKILAHTVYPISHRVQQGAALYFQHIDVPEIETTVRSIAKKLNYTGHLAFDFVQSEKDGYYYAIECNPRLTSGIHLFEGGTQLTNLFQFQNKDLPSTSLYGSEDRHWMILFGMLLYAFPKIHSIKEIKNLFLDLKKAKDVVFSWKDLKPFIQQFSSLYHFYKISRKQGVSLLEAATYDIEWNGTEDSIFTP